MNFKRKITKPQGYIHVGMTFFMVGILATQIADGKLIGALFTNITKIEGSQLNTLQGFADGFSLPMLAASIFFNLRGFTLLRSR